MAVAAQSVQASPNAAPNGKRRVRAVFRTMLTRALAVGNRGCVNAGRGRSARGRLARRLGGTFLLHAGNTAQIPQGGGKVAVNIRKQQHRRDGQRAPQSALGAQSGKLVGMQVKLLRVLQEQTLRRVGGTVDIPVDVRIIAATNRNLKEEVEAGRFRRDLYYRVAVVTQEMPPLRNRAEDIPLLARFFLEKMAEQGNTPLDMDEEALEALRRYPFPGNVRELANILERAAVFCPPGGSIGLAHLPQDVQEALHAQPQLGAPVTPPSVSSPASAAGAPGVAVASPATVPFSESLPAAVAECDDEPSQPYGEDASGALLPLAEVEKRHILHALELAGDNRTLAADMVVKYGISD